MAFGAGWLGPPLALWLLAAAGMPGRAGGFLSVRPAGAGYAGVSHGAYSGGVIADARRRSRGGRGSKRAPTYQPVSTMPTRDLRKTLFLSAKYANLTQALETYQEMKSRRYKMSREEVNTLLYVSQACEGGGVDLTLRLYEELKGNFTADENTDVMLVRCYADLGRVEDALGLIAARREAGQPPRLRNYSPVLQRLWRDGDDAAASRVWQELVGAGVAVTEEVIIGMLECYAARGRDRFVERLGEVEELLSLLGRTVLNVTGTGLDAVEAAFRSVAPGAVERVRIPYESAEGSEDGEEEEGHEAEGSSTAGPVGECPHCQGRLELLSLTVEDRDRFRERTVQLAEERAASWAAYLKAQHQRQQQQQQHGPGGAPEAGPSKTEAGEGPAATEPQAPVSVEQSLKSLDEWLAARPPFDYVIDAPNVAYYGQNYEHGRFSFQQVDTVLSAIRARGQRAFITIPTKYLHRRIPHNVRHSNIPKARSGAHRALEEHEADLIKRWMEENIVFRVPRGHLDDLYWMYATVSTSNRRPLKAVSNDCLRDHWEDLLDMRTFNHWRTSQVESYSFLHNANGTAVGVRLRSAPFSREAQRTASSGCFHLPSDRADDDWLCIDLKAVLSEAPVTPTGLEEGPSHLSAQHDHHDHHHHHHHSLGVTWDPSPVGMRALEPAVGEGLGVDERQEERSRRRQASGLGFGRKGEVVAQACLAEETGGAGAEVAHRPMRAAWSFLRGLRFPGRRGRLGAEGGQEQEEEKGPGRP